MRDLGRSARPWQQLLLLQELWDEEHRIPWNSMEYPTQIPWDQPRDGSHRAQIPQSQIFFLGSWHLLKLQIPSNTQRFGSSENHGILDRSGFGMHLQLFIPMGTDKFHWDLPEFRTVFPYLDPRELLQLPESRFRIPEKDRGHSHLPRRLQVLPEVIQENHLEKSPVTAKAQIQWLGKIPHSQVWVFGIVASPGASHSWEYPRIQPKIRGIGGTFHSLNFGILAPPEASNSWESKDFCDRKILNSQVFFQDFGIS